MTFAAFQFIVREFVRGLLDAVLRPLYVAFRDAERSGDARRTETLRHRFFRVLDACDCHPFCVEVDACGLWILDEPSTDD